MRGVFQDGRQRRDAAELARAAPGMSHLLRKHLLRPHHLRRQHPSRLAEALEPRLLLAVTPVGPEFLVNTTAAGAQRAAAVAADADGDFVVAWHGSYQQGVEPGVYAQRYNAAGGAVGGEFAVHTTGNSNLPGAPSVAMDADGDFVIAWQAPDEAGLDIEVYARRYDAAGAPVGGKFRVNTTTSRAQGFPDVAMDADGDFVVAWQSSGQDGSDYGIYARRYDAGGAPAGGEFRVNTYTDGNQHSPSVAADASGNFVVAWTSVGQDDFTGVYAQRYAASGAAAGEEFRVNAFTAGHQNSPSAAMDADGDFVVAWQSNGQDGSLYGVYARRYSAAGTAGVEFPVNTFTLADQLAPSAAMDAGGNFVIAWEGVGTGDAFGVHARRFTAGAGGGADGNEFLVNTFTDGGQSVSSVAMDADGDFVAAWQSYRVDGSGYGIYAQRFDESTETAGPSVTEVSAGGNVLTPGERLVHTVAQAVITFSENLSTAGGATGEGSATNPASYRVTRNGVDVSSQISSVTFGLNPATRKHEATLTFAPPLAGDADYVLTAREVLRDPAGNALDGNLDGAPGGDYALAFSLRPPVNIGPEFRVNTYTVDDQAAPSVAMDGDGDSVVVWQSLLQDGSFEGIYAQRYNASGAALGLEFRVNTTTANRQAAPAVAMDADGDFVVAWHGYQQDGSGAGIYARRYNAAGAAQGPEFRVNTFTMGDQLSPSVAMDADGDFVVAWTSLNEDGSDFESYARRYNAAGAAQGPEFRVNTFTANSQVLPSVAMDADGDFVVAWHSSEQDGSSHGVYAQRYNAAGAAQGPEFRVNTFTDGSQGAASVGMDADGDFVVAWSSQFQDGSLDGVYAQRYTADGAARGAEFRVNTFTAHFQSSPSVAMDADGDFVVAWDSFGQDGSGFGVYAQRYTAAGQASGGEFRVNTFTTNSQLRPSVAADADGDFLVAWEDNAQDPSGLGVYAQRYAANERPTTPGIPEVNVPQDAPDTSIDLFAAFADSTDPDPLLTFSVVTNTNPALFSATPITVSPTAGTLTLDYAPGQSGTAVLTVRVTDTGGLFTDATFTVNVTPPAPVVTTAAFVYQLGPPQRVRFTFSRDVRDSLSAADLAVERVGGGPVEVSAPAYDGATNTATFAFAAGTLPDGNYRATLLAAGVTNAAGVPLPADYVLNFFVLAGDINRDRSVNGTDFATLAANFGKSAQPYASGDLNGDGFVNGTDFAILAGNFGKTIPAPPVAVAPAAAAPAAAAAAPGLPSPARGAAPRPRRSLAFAAATPAKPSRRRPGPGILSSLTRGRGRLT